MSLFYSDLHVQILARGLLEPGERLDGRVMTERNPWYGLGLLARKYLLLATDRRLIVVEHKRAWLHRTFAIAEVESIAWRDVEQLALKGVLVKRKVRLVAQGPRGRKNLVMKIPTTFAPLRDNVRAARAVAAAFDAQRALGPASMPPSLPPSGYPMPYQGGAAHGLPPASFGPPMGPPHPLEQTVGATSYRSA